ncbi:hypothetical protein [Haloferula sp.]|uniref:hypothetical protein n=1 Tax=Haloferula sp. TaxID=2497595 RepID=UPI003C713228
MILHYLGTYGFRSESQIFVVGLLVFSITILFYARNAAEQDVVQARLTSLPVESWLSGYDWLSHGIWSKIKLATGMTLVTFLVCSCDQAPDRSVNQNEDQGALANSLFEDRDKLVAAVDHRFVEDRLIVTAVIKNQSTKSITFVDHPDFCGISVYAADRQKDDLINGGVFVTYHRASEADLKIVPPGGSFKYERDYIVRAVEGDAIEVEEYPQFFEPKSFMRITDDALQAVFSYGKYPDRLPEDVEGKGHNFLMTRLEAREFFLLNIHKTQHPE